MHSEWDEVKAESYRGLLLMKRYHVSSILIRLHFMTPVIVMMKTVKSSPVILSRGVC